MVWTTEKPHSPGFYWWEPENSRRTRVIEAQYDSAGELCAYMTSGPFPVAELEGRFGSEAIGLPMEPKPSARIVKQTALDGYSFAGSAATGYDRHG